MSTRRPTITTGPASRHAGPDEIIREFSDGASSGLLSIRRHPVTHRLTVEVYRTDADVSTIGNAPTSTYPDPQEVYAPAPDDARPGDIPGMVTVFGRRISPDEAEALATRLQLMAGLARSTESAEATR